MVTLFSFLLPMPTKIIRVPGGGRALFLGIPIIFTFCRAPAKCWQLVQMHCLPPTGVRVAYSGSLCLHFVLELHAVSRKEAILEPLASATSLCVMVGGGGGVETGRWLEAPPGF